MQKEIEVKYLDIDVNKLQKLLKHVGAQKKFDSFFEEWIFFRDEWRPKNGRIRIRKHDDDIIFTYKESIGSNLDRNYETEFKVDNIIKAIEFAKKMAPQRRRQQKRRICYELNGTSIDIDFWPKLPPLVEIEAKSKSALEKMAILLQLDQYKRFEQDAYYLYRDIYNIDLDKTTEVIF